MDFKDYIQGKGKHSIDLLLAISEISKEKEQIAWKDVKEWFNKNGKNISDQTYRKRSDELEQLGLVTKEPMTSDPFKKVIKLTDKGLIYTALLRDFLGRIEEANKIVTAP